MKANLFPFRGGGKGNLRFHQIPGGNTFASPYWKLSTLSKQTLGSVSVMTE